MKHVQREQSISVVIVSWNVCSRLRVCLDSVISACRPTDEIIVIDNDSSDESVNMIESEFSRVRLIRNSENRQFGPAANQGIAVSKGELILILNPDTVIPAMAIAEADHALDEHPELGMIGFRMVNSDGTLQSLGRATPTLANHSLQWILPYSLYALLESVRMRTSQRSQLGGLLQVPSLSGSAFVIRRNVIETVGMFDESLPVYGEDIDLVERVRDAGWKIGCLADIPIIHEGGASFRQVPGARLNALTAQYAVLVKRGQNRAVLRTLLTAASAIRLTAWTIVGWVAPTKRDRASYSRRLYWDIVKSTIFNAS